MLIPFDTCFHILYSYNKTPTGILHIGAHQCEELNAYMKNGVNPQKIYWIDAIKEKDLYRRPAILLENKAY